MRKIKNITKRHIALAQSAGACPEALAWLSEQPRTWAELVAHNPEWAVWAMINMPDCPIDLTGITSSDRARVMSYRPDCPIDLTGLTSYSRAWVMLRRPDCPRG